MPSRSALVLAVGLAFAAPVAHCAGLGRITVQSALGQPLRAEVEVTAVNREEAASLAVRLASAAAFRQANLDYNSALTGLRVTLDRRAENTFVVRIASPNAVSEPYLDLLLELTSSAGRVVREYTILLDPPALRTAQDVVAPAAARAPSTATAQRAAAPAPAAPAPRPAAATAAAAPVGSPYTVQRGETLGGIAEKTRPATASLDQMLVALFRANPGAFIGGNMNNLRAGSALILPQEQQVLATDAATARREVVAQSADFARYRSRLAEAASTAAPGTVAAAGQGKVTTKVADGSAGAPSGDQLKIAQAAPAAKSGDEAIARDRQIKELLDRVAELERTNQQLQKVLELQSKSGAQAQTAAEGRPAAAPAPAAPAPVAAAPGPAPQAAPTAPVAVPPPSAAVPAAPPATPAAPTPAPAPAPAAARADEPGFLAGILGGSNLPVLGGLGALLVAALGYLVYRRRVSSGAREDYDLSAEAAQGNSLFGQTGGRSIDTATQSGFSSSFIPAATQVDSTEVDPVAEADVYIAYGREEQAEDILKEALRLQPDRHAARVKLMEILARRNDKAGFARLATDLMARTGQVGEDWDRGAAIGRLFDPGNPLYISAATQTAEMIGREAMTELRLDTPTTIDGPGAGASGLVAEGLMSGFEMAGSSTAKPVTRPTAMRPTADSAVPSESHGAPSTLLPLDSRANVVAQTVSGNSTKPVREGAPTALSELEFEAIAPATQIVEPAAAPAPATPDGPLGFDLQIPAAAATTSPRMPNLPDLDLNLPTAAPKTQQAATATGQAGALDFDLPLTPAPVTRPGPTTRFPVTSPITRPQAPLPDEQLGRSTLLGGLTALPEGITRMAPNTDQATVPLIDFDLTGADMPLSTSPGRTVALTGSPMASQIATKLDLARGYIDLGVKDGARELLDEVMRDGTREQRQAAVELMKQIDR